MPRLSLKTVALGAFACLALSATVEARPILNDDILYLDDGSTLQGNPQTLGQVYNEINYEATTNCIGVCTSGRETNDPDAVVFANEGNDPNASNNTEPPGTQVDPTTQNPTDPFIKLFHKEDSFGNSLFGGGYKMDAQVRAVRAEKKMEAYAEGSAWGQVFFMKRELMKVRAVAASQQSGPVTATVTLYINGQETLRETVGRTTEPTNPGQFLETFTLYSMKEYAVPFFQAEKTYVVLWIPLKVTAWVGGKAGFDVKATVKATSAKLVATPRVGVYANATASASIWVASIGVEGNLTLVEASLPSSGQVVASSCDALSWDLKTTFDVVTLAGNLKAYVKIKLLFIKK
ncbi:MAG: hypothetical protein EOO71_02240, partial [Myxococcaceae bacterium]